MAYEKDAGVIAKVASFRQQSNQMTKNGFSGRSKGGIPYFVDMYQPTVDDTDIIRLLAGEFLQDQLIGEGDVVEMVQVISPFVKFIEHFHGGLSKSAICSAGAFASFKEKRQPCVGCDIYWETAARNAAGRWESSCMSRQNKYAFAVLDYSNYHKIPQFDRDTGKPKINERTKEPYFNWVKCAKQGCDGCRGQVETKAGDSRHWPMNWSQLQILRASELDIGKSCVTCCSTECVRSIGWICQQCGECVIDMETTTMKPTELVKTTDNPVKCTHCGATELLTEVYECRVCAPRGQTGVRASLFDVDLRVKLVSTESGKLLQVVGFSAPQPVAPGFTELAKPIDLVARYAPDPISKQQEKFGIVNRQPVTNNAPPARAYQNPYGNKPTP